MMSNNMETILEIARENQQRARDVIRRLGLVEAWEAIGAEVHLVGSLATGLLMKHLDIDYHIYSESLVPTAGFAVMERLASCPGVRKVEYVNGADTSERCVEWHLWYEDERGDTWQVDLIHMPKGSPYDGYFERMAERIVAVMTPEMRETILRLKYETPDTEKMMGVEYYRAVIEGGVRTYDAFLQWRSLHPVEGVLHWIP